MTPRENILGIFRRTGYEWAPVQFDLCPSQFEEFRKQVGGDVPYSDYYAFPWRNVRGPVLPPREPVDWKRYFTEDFAEGTKFSAWGVAHEPNKDSMHMTRMYHPMKSFTSIEQMQAYPYPDFANADFSRIRGDADAIHARGFATHATMACTVWEIAWYLRSMEELMMDMLGESEMAVYHFDRITEIACILARAYAEGGVDILHLGDDVGMQQTIMMSEDLYRTWLKPRLASVVKAAKDANPEIVVTYHSCGYVRPFIPDLIEVGVDVLNPVQPECMSFAEIHAEFGDRLSFWGTLGTQTTLPFGTPEEVRETVLRNLAIAGEQGGLLCSPTHLVEPEVPWKNIEAYVQACRDYK
jgi:uroporphyrinogen decarboxylase